jgi:hypothetical protein
VKKLGVIRARERLAAFDDSSYPYMSKESRRSLVRAMERVIERGEPSTKPKPSRPTSLEEMRGGLAGMGIAVEVVTKDA